MKTNFTRYVFILSVFFLPYNSLFAQFGGGEGSPEDPYRIASAEHLNNIRGEYLGYYFKQTNDIDLSGYPNWIPIGDADNPFTGNYMGNYYSISNLTINTGSLYAGLFGYVNDGVILTVLIENASVSCLTENGFVGALCGKMVFGGDVGISVNICYSDGTVTGGNANVGGLIGANSGAIIDQSYSVCSVEGVSGAIGGLVGYADLNSIILQCASEGNVIGGNNASVAGLVGLNNGVITQCFSRCTVTGGSGARVGGFVGSNSMGEIDNCYGFGDVSSGTFSASIGGLVGYMNMGAIECCYSKGLITTGSFSSKGGLLGVNVMGIGTVSNSYYDQITSGQSDDVGKGIPKTTGQMKVLETFQDWDFLIVWEIVGENYPRLQENPDGALPVELTSFSALVENDMVELRWTTATEVNNYGFEIQRSVVSGQLSDWETIGFVQGHGNSNSPKEYSFVDVCPPAGSLKYRLKQIDTDGKYEYYGTIAEINFNTTGTEDPATAGLPTEYALEQNYPNPFNPVTVISYQLPVKGNVYIKVYDVLGKEVSTLVDEEKNAGYHKVEWNESGLASGIYFYMISVRAEGSEKIFRDVKKMILQK